jgi:hypothetical protein
MSAYGNKQGSTVLSQLRVSPRDIKPFIPEMRQDVNSEEEDLEVNPSVYPSVTEISAGRFLEVSLTI